MESKSEFILSKDFKVEFNFSAKSETLVANSETVVILSDNVDIGSVLSNSDVGSNNLLKQDIETQKYQWVYTENSRILYLYTQDKHPKKLRDLGVKAVDLCLQLKAYDVSVFIPTSIKVEEAKHFIQSMILWNYKFEMKTHSQTQLLTQMHFNFECAQDEAEAKELEFYKHATKNTLLVRDLVNTRANEATPTYMENVIRHYAKFSDKIQSVESIIGKDLDDAGLKVIYNVGKGATDPPRLVH